MQPHPDAVLLVQGSLFQKLLGQGMAGQIFLQEGQRQKAIGTDFILGPDPVEGWGPLHRRPEELAVDLRDMGADLLFHIELPVLPVPDQEDMAPAVQGFQLLVPLPGIRPVSLH